MSARLDSVAKVSGVTASSKEFEDIKKEYCGQTKDGFPDLSSIKLNFSVLSPLCKKILRNLLITISKALNTKN